jgi:hypothetical protein
MKGCLMTILWIAILPFIVGGIIFTMAYIGVLFQK